MNRILEVLGVKSIPPGQTEHSLLSKLLKNPEIIQAVLDLLVARNADSAILTILSPAAKTRLLNHIGCGPAVAQKVSWAVCRVPNSGQWMIVGKVFGENIFFTGTPENAPLLKFRGETCPRHIVEEYSRVYVAMGFEQDAQQHGHFQQREK